MSSFPESRAKNFISPQEAGKRLGYTSTRIIQLVKAEKIVGKKIDSRWSIDPSSLENFLVNHKKNLERNRVRLQEKRKSEFQASKQKREIEIRHGHEIVVESPFRTKINSFVPLVAILSLVLGYSSLIATRNSDAFKNIVSEVISRAHTHSFSSLGVASVSNSMTYREEDKETLGVLPASTAEASESNDLSLVILPADASSTTIDSIRAEFSDPVTVSKDPSDPSTGIIRAEFKERKNTEFRYVLVPVAQKNINE